MPTSVFLEPVLRWYAEHARSLPWRERSATAWPVLVSEVMLQQTPVARVLPVYDVWVQRWPTPALLAADSAGEAVRMWGRLGYPRRALRLHEAATTVVTDYGGVVPSTHEQLRELPGVGDYTAAAVVAFAYRRRAVVLDTNVRRVLARAVSGQQQAPRTVQAVERGLAERLLPADGATASAWSVAVMELGALVCTARAPRCSACPLTSRCAWKRAGFPASTLLPAPAQRYAGTDRQCRGRILAVLRDTKGPVPLESIERLSDRAQSTRALQSLLADGLVVKQEEGALTLPR